MFETLLTITRKTLSLFARDALVRRLVLKWVLCGLGGIIVPIVIILSIWSPYVRHFYGRGWNVSTAAVAALRQTPSEAMLRELSRQDGMMRSFYPILEDAVSVSEGLLNGEAHLADAGTILVEAPFDPKDVQKIPLKIRMWFHGFAAPQLYLRAYELTDRTKYLAAARDYILAWGEYEGGLRKPDGFIWNDHSIAQRAHILIEFWRLYRNSEIYEPSAARRIFRVVTKTGRMLADPSLYVYRTNHGIMQDLALMQMSLAFPQISKFSEFGKTAIKRAKQHIPYYLNSEGGILEHSAGYHEFGVRLLGALFRDMSLLKSPVQDPWFERYRRAIDNYQLLLLPEGTMPRWGDTISAPGNVRRAIDPGQLGQSNAASSSLDGNRDRIAPRGVYPIWGISVWRRMSANKPTMAVASQTLVTWSYFPEFGHKHADELSLYLWARGTAWWTAIGNLNWANLPDGVKIDSAWDWSNAPHLLGEGESSERTSTLCGSWTAENFNAIDILRQTRDGFSVRRQVLQSGSDVWITIDAVNDKTDRRYRTVWQTDPAVTIARGSQERSYSLLDPYGNVLDVEFIGEPALRMKTVRAQKEPLLSWTVNEESILNSLDHSLVPTSAILVEAPSRSSLAIQVSSLRRQTESKRITSVSLRRWIDDEHWTLALTGAGGNVLIQRSGRWISRTGGGESALEIVSKEAFAANKDIQYISTRFRESQRSYDGPVRELWFYRVRMSLVLAGLLIFQLIALGVLATRKPGTLVGVSSGCAAIWLGIGCWMWLLYF